MASRKHRVECECGDPSHFVQINYDEYGGYERRGRGQAKEVVPPDADIRVWWVGDRNFGFWKRLKHGLQFAFGRQDMIVSDFVISKESARETGQFLLDIAARAEEWEAEERTEE